MRRFTFTTVASVLISTPFLVRVDLWLFEREYLLIRPWIVLVSAFSPFVALFVLRALNRSSYVIRSDAVLVVLMALLVGVVEISGVIKWSVWPEAAHSMFFYWLNVLTVFCGFCIGRALHVRSRMHVIFVCALLIEAGAVFIDWLFPGTLSLSSMGGRPAGFIGNPNGAAFAAAVLLIGCLDWKRSSWRQALISAVALAIVVVSGSRGGLLVILTVLGLLWFSSIPRMHDLTLLVARLVSGYAIAATILVAIAMSAWISGSRLVDVAKEGVLEDHATEERLLALQESFELISTAPWLGRGTGYVYTMDVGPHNTILRIWIENGVFAVLAYALLYLAIVFLALKRRDWWIGATAVVALLMGMVSHNMLEDRTLLISFGIFLGMSVTARTHDEKRLGIQPGLSRVSTA